MAEWGWAGRTSLQVRREKHTFKLPAATYLGIKDANEGGASRRWDEEDKVWKPLGFDLAAFRPTI